MTISDRDLPRYSEPSAPSTPTPKRAFKGVWIPKAIWEAKDITWMEKCLLAEIDSLDDGSGCYATNQYLAEVFSSTPNSIKELISRLRKKGWITDKKAAVNGGSERRISVVLPPTTIDGSRQQPLAAASVTTNGTPPSHIRRDTKKRKAMSESSSLFPAGEKANKETQGSFAKELTEEWCREFQERFGVKYRFNGGKDGKAVQLLEKTGMTAKEIVGLARRAWDLPKKFYATIATSIMGFNSQWNEINSELARIEAPALPN